MMAAFCAASVPVQEDLAEVRIGVGICLTKMLPDVRKHSTKFAEVRVCDWKCLCCKFSAGGLTLGESLCQQPLHNSLNDIGNDFNKFASVRVCVGSCLCCKSLSS